MRGAAAAVVPWAACPGGHSMRARSMGCCTELVPGRTELGGRRSLVWLEDDSHHDNSAKISL